MPLLERDQCCALEILRSAFTLNEHFVTPSATLRKGLSVAKSLRRRLQSNDAPLLRNILSL